MSEIRVDELYEDDEGRNWRVQGIDTATNIVRLRLANPPERLVTVDEFEAKFKIGGIGGMLEKWKRERDELRARQDEPNLND